jgi:hypothetical protein
MRDFYAAHRNKKRHTRNKRQKKSANPSKATTKTRKRSASFESSQENASMEIALRRDK